MLRIKRVFKFFNDIKEGHGHMKSYFLTFVLCASFCQVASAQISRKQKETAQKKKAAEATLKPSIKKAPPGAPISPKTTIVPVSGPNTIANENRTHFTKFWERVNISYFGAFTSSRLGGFNADYASTSPEFSTPASGCDKNCDTVPQNLWQQLRFDYNFGGGRKFMVGPRWSNYFGSNPSNRRVAMALEDAIVGFHLPLVATADGKFTWWLRPLLRLPTSGGTRTGDVPDWGDVTYQPEIVTMLNYTFNKTWSVLYWMQNRIWIYEDRYSNARHRIVSWVQVSQKLDDVTSLLYGGNHFLQNDRNWESINDKKPVYKDLWQDAYIGLYRDITPKFNLQPMIGAYVNDPKFDEKSFYFAMWVGYTIK